jgi:hypothetical protein
MSIGWEDLEPVDIEGFITATRTNDELTSFAWLKAWKLEAVATSEQNKTVQANTVLADALQNETVSLTVISFPVPFATVPEVLLQLMEQPANPVWWQLDAVSVSSFTIAMGKINLSAFGGTADYEFGYIAIG